MRCVRQSPKILFEDNCFIAAWVPTETIPSVKSFVRRRFFIRFYVNLIASCWCSWRRTFWRHEFGQPINTMMGNMNLPRIRHRCQAAFHRKPEWKPMFLAAARAHPFVCKQTPRRTRIKIPLLRCDSLSFAKSAYNSKLWHFSLPRSWMASSSSVSWFRKWEITQKASYVVCCVRIGNLKLLSAARELKRADNKDNGSDGSGTKGRRHESARKFFW